jgi:hypothetical protein
MIAQSMVELNGLISKSTVFIKRSIRVADDDSAFWIFKVGQEEKGINEDSITHLHKSLSELPFVFVL